jgi:hypothetical protein
MRTAKLPFSAMRGRLSACLHRPGDPLPPLPQAWDKNTLQFGLADAFGLLLSGGLTSARLGMYIQYCNNMGSWTTPTGYGRSGKTYFHTLADGISDIIRVPLVIAPASAASSDVYEFNSTTFLAQSAGANGAAGLIQPAVTFQRSVSTIVGGGLIAMPTPDDYTKDIVLTRGYLSDTLLRPASPFEVLMRWQIIVG